MTQDENELKAILVELRKHLTLTEIKGEVGISSYFVNELMQGEPRATRACTGSRVADFKPQFNRIREILPEILANRRVKNKSKIAMGTTRAKTTPLSGQENQEHLLKLAVMNKFHYVNMTLFKNPAKR